MNLRILKKLSKRAAPLLPLLGDTRCQFRAEHDDNYHGMMILDRTCWDRSNCHPTYQPHGRAIAFNTRSGHRIVMRPPSQPLNGTIMVGSMSGYYEPEWEEECAFSSLRSMVSAHFTDWSRFDPAVGSFPGMTRDLSTVAKLFAAAHDMIKEIARD